MQNTNRLRYIEFVLVKIFKYYSNIYIGFRRLSDIRADDNDHYNENDVLLPAPYHPTVHMHTRRKHTPTQSTHPYK